DHRWFRPPRSERLYLHGDGLRAGGGTDQYPHAGEDGASGTSAHALRRYAAREEVRQKRSGKQRPGIPRPFSIQASGKRRFAPAIRIARTVHTAAAMGCDEMRHAEMLRFPRFVRQTMAGKEQIS